MKRLAWFTAVILGTLTVVVLLWEFRLAILLFVLSLAATAAVRPALDALAQRGMPAWLSLILVYVLGLAIVGALLYAINGALVAELQRASDDLARYYERVQIEWPIASPVQQAIADQLPAADELYQALAGGDARLLLRIVPNVTLGIFDFLSNLLIVLVLSIYWSADRVHFERLWLSLLPAEARARARRTWRAIESGVGAYIRSEVVQSFLAGLLLALGYQLLDLRYPTLLALGGAVAWLIPMIGVILALGPALLVGLMNGVTTAALAASYTLLIFLVLELAIEPRLFRHRYLVSPLLVVLLILVLAEAFGLLGLLLAPPLAAAIQILLGNLLEQPIPAGTEHDQQAVHIADLQERITAVRGLAEDTEAAASPEIKNLLDRLSHLMDQANRGL